MSASLSLRGVQPAVGAVSADRQAALFKVHSASILCPEHVGDSRIGPDVTVEKELSVLLHDHVHRSRELRGICGGTSQTTLLHLTQQIVDFVLAPGAER